MPPFLRNLLIATLWGFSAGSLVAGIDLLDLGGSDYRLTIASGAAELITVEGASVLEVSAGAGEEAVVRLRPPAGTYWDLREEVVISLEVENRSPVPIHFRVDTLSDSAYGNNIERGRGDLMHLGWLDPNESRPFNCFLTHDSRTYTPAHDLSVFDNLLGYPGGLVLRSWMGMDPARASEITIRLPTAGHARSLRIHRVFRTGHGVAPAWQDDPAGFFPFIDRYGQYTKEDWPGKVFSDEDLLEAKAAEESDLAAHPSPTEFNAYGGWLGAPPHAATGHFRTEKVEGQWWLIDPEGRLFWSWGVNSAGALASGRITNKQGFFAWLPRDEPSTRPFLSGSRYLIGDLNSWRKYGPDFADTHLERSLRRMCSWRMNTLGSWQRLLLGQPVEAPLPYTLYVNYQRPTLDDDKIVNPFHPDFRNRIRGALQDYPGTFEDPFCIGYFFDNELSWGANGVFNAVMTASDTSAQAAFIAFLEEKYTTIGALQAAWGMSIGSFAEIGGLTPATIRGVASPDVDAFYAHFAETYFQTIREEITAAAPNKLYLGCRWNNSNAPMLHVAADYVDVFSFNLYRPEISGHTFYGIDKPFIATEFHFGSIDRGKFSPGLGWASDSRNRGERMVHYVRSALSHPLCVGAHWFAWMDQPTWGRNDGENYGIGLVDTNDAPHPEFREAVREAGSTLYPFRYDHSEVLLEPLDLDLNAHGGAIDLAVPAELIAPGRVYFLEHSSDAGLKDPWTLVDVLKARVSDEGHPHTHSPAPATHEGFFRVRVEWAP